MRDAFTDWKIYLSVLIYWGNAICNYGYDESIPSVMHFFSTYLLPQQMGRH